MLLKIRDLLTAAEIARLVALSRELSQIEVPSEAQVTSLHERSLTEG